MAITKLGVYNDALRILGEQSLASLSQSGVARRSLDESWVNAVESCLEQGFWNFATATIEIYSNPDLTPSFGFQYAFDKPEDWVKTVGVALDETFAHPFTRYEDETDFWHADNEPLYIRYVSKDADYGFDLSRWPQTFRKAVAAYLADDVCVRVTGSETKKDATEKGLLKALADARSKDAMNEPARFPPVGTWVQSRSGGVTSIRRRYDRA